VKNPRGLSLLRIPEAWLALSFLAFVFPAKAVLFFHTGDTNFNTTPPTHALTNSGWQFEGEWVGFNGTVISSNCFITAQHIGGAVGGLFTFQNVQYPTVTNYDDPNTDLRIWRVSGQFPIYAPLYAKRNEGGKALIVIGRGTQRGDEVRLKNRLRGWQWGVYDGVQRWGQNRVNGIVTSGKGELLRASFNAGAGRNEATLSVGDSGGAVFIKDGKFYKLAGINYGVDGPYNTTNSGTGFNAALFNQRGFYVESTPGSGTWEVFPQHTGRIASSFYATRVSSRMSWITNVLALPAP
jgi:hypothetical protein